jgi:hypothetical protein
MGYRDNNNIKNGCFIHLPVSLVSSYITSDTTSLNFPYYIDYVKLIYAMCFEKNVSASAQKQWINLLVDERISAFNEWRMKNLIIRPDISGTKIFLEPISMAFPVLEQISLTAIYLRLILSKRILERLILRNRILQMHC